MSGSTATAFAALASRAQPQPQLERHRASRGVASLSCVGIARMLSASSLRRARARRRRLLATTLTELNAIAALARMGLSSKPNAG